jgi:23S rRNA pseudouridine2457 synthase
LKVVVAKDQLLLFNKPFRVLCKFTDARGRPTLADYVSVPDVYPAGRLDYDSEGLVLLTNVGAVQHWISHPRYALQKTYWVQVERIPDPIALRQLATGVALQDGMTKAAHVERMEPPQVWPRHPPIRERKSVPTAWIALTIGEGRNRQVRRMTAAVGYPTLRLIRCSVGPWDLGSLQPGEYTQVKCPRSWEAILQMLR